MEFRYQTGDTLHEILLERDGEGWIARIGDRKHRVTVTASDPGRLALLIDGRSVAVHYAREEGAIDLVHAGSAYRLVDPEAEADRGGSAEAGGGGDGRISTPMPGKVVAIEVKEGVVVVVGRSLIILESMKMQNDIVSDVNGQVARIHHGEGDNVEFGDLLIEITVAGDDD